MSRSIRAGLIAIALLAGCTPEPEPLVIRGIVLDPVAAAPVAGARVRARDVPGEALTDAQGRFELPVPAGVHDLWVERSEYLTVRYAGARAGSFVEVRSFPREPRDEDVARYFGRQPPRRHEHPAHERPGQPSEIVEGAEGDVGRATFAGTEIELPATIRVWRASGTPLQPTAANGWADRSCDPAAVVIELPLEEYVKGVIPHEWIPSWQPEALRAGAIAARSYASSWSLRGGRWDCADVDDGTVTQVYRDERFFPTDEAVDATAGVVVVRDGRVVSAEYSAENSDPTAHGVAEPTCTGTERRGHGRGMCQWGTQRWASGTCANPPCNFGAFGAEPKDHVWMVEHYYPGAQAVSVAPPVPCQVLGPEGGVLDDTGPCFRAYGPSAYWRTEDAGYGGHLHWTNAFEADRPSNWARWTIELASPGRYRIEVYVDGAWGVWGETRYRVSHAHGEDVVIVDQGAADGWVELGTFELGPSGAVVVEDDYRTAVPPDQHIVADALRVTPERAEPALDGGAPVADGGAAVDGGAPEVAGGPIEAPSWLTGCGVGRGAGRSWPAAALLALALARRRRRR